MNGDLQPSSTLNLIWENFPPSAAVADLGCGPGNDALFLARQNFQVTAVDYSVPFIENLRAIKEAENLSNLELFCESIQDFELTANKYKAIICANVLNFSKKEDALQVIANIKEHLLLGGYAIIEVFTEKDPTFNAPRKFRCYFAEQELLQLFSDFKIIYYLEKLVFDPAHRGAPTDHYHGVARIIAQK